MQVYWLIASMSDRRLFVISMATRPLSIPAVNDTSIETAQGMCLTIRTSIPRSLVISARYLEGQ
jgi:hypothetical protein